MSFCRYKVGEPLDQVYASTWVMLASVYRVDSEDGTTGVEGNKGSTGSVGPEEMVEPGH